MTTRVLLKRVSNGWVDRYRAYEVIVNGEPRADLKRGEQISLEVDPGHVQIQLRIDWCKSRPIEMDLSLGQEAQITCRPRTILTVFYGVTFGRDNYMQLEVERAR